MPKRKSRDRIHAVIANSGINQDGKTVGLNTPSGDAQAALSSRVYREAGLSPADTTFVEAHGTVGLPLDGANQIGLTDLSTGNSSRRSRRDVVRL